MAITSPPLCGLNLNDKKYSKFGVYKISPLKISERGENLVFTKSPPWEEWKGEILRPWKSRNLTCMHCENEESSPLGRPYKCWNGGLMIEIYIYLWHVQYMTLCIHGMGTCLLVSTSGQYMYICVPSHIHVLYDWSIFEFWCFKETKRNMSSTQLCT